MAFVQAKCENCGAILTVDPSLKAAICDHCGGAYVVQDSINYYNSFTKVEHMHADVVNISDESSSEGRLKAADAFMKLKKYPEAKAEYEKVTALTPQNYKGWYGIIESATCEFTGRIIDKNTIAQLEDCAKSVEMFAPAETCDDFLERYRAYITAEREKNSKEKEQIRAEIAKAESAIKAMDEQINFTQSMLRELINDTNKIGRKINAARSPKKAVNSTTFLIVVCVINLIVGLFLARYSTAGSVFTLAISFISLGILTVQGLYVASLPKKYKVLMVSQTNQKNRIQNYEAEKTNLTNAIEQNNVKLMSYE